MTRSEQGRDAWAMPKMKAAVFLEPGCIRLEEKPIPDIGPFDALVRVTTTTICGTDVHILKGDIRSLRVSRLGTSRWA